MDQRVTVVLGLLVAIGCGGKSDSAPLVQPETVPLPTAMFTGQKVAVFPVTYFVADEELGWRDAIGDREERLHRADSLLEEFLLERVPEADWVFPAELRRAARRNPGIVSDPDRMGAAALRTPGLEKVPSPLISNMRNLIAVVGDRYALVPAAVIVGEPIDTTLEGGMVELTVSVVDVRQALIRWYGFAYGVADEPWAAFRIALDDFLPIRR